MLKIAIIALKHISSVHKFMLEQLKVFTMPYSVLKLENDVIDLNIILR